MDVLFESLCDEPEGLVNRVVTPFPFTPENLKNLWSKVNQFPTLMGCEIKDFDQMLHFFITPDVNGSNHKTNGLCVQIDDLVGIFWLTDIKWPKEASIHYTFFDRRHRGRIDLCKKAIEYVFKTYKFHRLFTQVPLYAKQPLHFVEKIGFKKDGRLRSNCFYRNEWYDSNIYSILESEV